MVATNCRNLLAAIDAIRGRRFTAPILPFAICDALKGVTFRYPLLPWDGVASSYPTDAAAASSCPKLGQLPTGVIVLQNAAPPLLSRSIRAQMYGFFIFQHRQRLRDFRFSHRCDRLRILPIISAIWPVVQMVDNFPARVRTLTFLNI